MEHQGPVLYTVKDSFEYLFKRLQEIYNRQDIQLRLIKELEEKVKNLELKI